MSLEPSIPHSSTSTLPPPPPASSSSLSGPTSLPIRTTTSADGTHTNPTTPIDELTPHLSHHPSPDTPGVHLQTPFAKSKSSSGGPSIFVPPEEGSAGTTGVMAEGGELGLGYDVDIKGKGRLGRNEEIEAGRSTPPNEVAMDDEEGAEKGMFPDSESLRAMQQKLDGMKAASGASPKESELIEMVDSLLTPSIEQLPFLNGQITAQRDTIRTLQEQAKLSSQLARIEKDRHNAERQAWRKELAAVILAKDNDTVNGIRPRKVLDLDVGYHQELEAANKRLEMDNRLMAPRLADTQRQIDKLVTELRHLRSHVVLSSDPLATDLDKREPGAEPRKIEPSKSVGPTTTMGDARTEHLLLAARKVRSMRAENDRVGRLTLEELKRGGVVGPDGGLGYSEGYGGIVEEESEEEQEASDEEDPIFMASGTGPKGKGKVQHTPLLPRPKKPVKKLPPTTPKSNRATANPETTPGGSNFSDLLRAAEMATRPGTPTPEAPSRTSGSRGATEARGPSPTKRRRDSRADDHVFALDLLAQASQLNEAQGDSADEEPSGTQRLGGAMKRESSPPSSEAGALAPAIDLHRFAAGGRKSSIDESIDPSLLDPSPTHHYPPPMLPQHPPAPPSTTPARRKQSVSEIKTPRMPQVAYYDYDESAMSHPGHHTSLNSPPPASKPLMGLMGDDMGGNYASPAGGTVPGLGKYVHLTSNMPARRVRSPYLKWTVEEDELLARAVAIHGEKWDLVSKGVPTRSYHQVRQRWLRKTGAFDKKPMDMGDEDKETSPTPRTPAQKKRKV